MDNGKIMFNSVFVDKRAGALYVQSYDFTPGRYPLFFQGTWIKKMVGDVPDAELGKAVREAMAASQAEDWPGDALRDEAARRRKAVLRLAGVRSERQYQTGLSSISVEYQSGGQQYRIIKMINEDPGEDMTGSEIEHNVPVQCSDEVLGATILGLLSDEGGEPG
jgi:hypothetical protein